MEIDRRKFLRAALFVAAAPVIVKASSLMPIRAPKDLLWRNIDPIFPGPSAITFEGPGGVRSIWLVVWGVGHPLEIHPDGTVNDLCFA